MDAAQSCLDRPRKHLPPRSRTEHKQGLERPPDQLFAEALLKRERVLQVVLMILGLLFIGLIYPLYADLRHSSWLLEMHNETEPMFLSFFIPLGVFLLLAARNPFAHRSLIAFTAWWNLAHGSVMLIETIQAWKHGVRRDFTDVIIVAVIGCVLLLLVPTKRSSSAAGA
jgi:hypothetical protein